MSQETKQILDLVLRLPAIEKARLIDHLLSSLDKPDEAIDALWRQEIADRIKAYQAGNLRTISLEQILAKYRT